MIRAVFLQSGMLVTPTLDLDYSAWHRGGESFALWYIEVRNTELINYLAQLQQHFADLLYQPNTRQFHITLFICGFLTAEMPVYRDDFHVEQMQQQIQKLSLKRPDKIYLKTGQISSFESALFVEVIDEQGILLALRDLFATCSSEITPLEYCPHLTLGLYRDEFASDVVLKKINEYEQKSFELEVDQLTFGTYCAQSLQAKLYPLQQFVLENR